MSRYFAQRTRDNNRIATLIVNCIASELLDMSVAFTGHFRFVQHDNA